MDLQDELERTYRKRTPTSRDRYERLREHLPGGVSSSTRAWDPYPFVVDRTEGAHLYDVDGNRYLDFDMNNGAGICGHTHPKITEALHEQLDEGTLYTMPHDLLGEAARLLKDRWQAIDSVRFTNSGTESTMHAIRAGRAYTGRDKIVKIEGAYHGAHDAVMHSVSPDGGKMGHPDRPATVPYSEGIPAATSENVLVAPFNDLDALRGLFAEHRNEIGVLILEPVMLNKAITTPRAEYLQGVRELCDEYGVVLLFDEVKTGVKIAPGGAAEYYGVDPDLVALAKSIGGETPVGAFGGRDAIMEGIAGGGAEHFGTYNGNPLALRALVVALRDVLTPDAYGTLADRSRRLATGYEEIMADTGLTGRVEHLGSQGMVLFTDRPVENYRQFRRAIDGEFHRLFWFGMANRGVIPHPHGARQQWTISVQHTDEHVDRTLEAFKELAPDLAAAQE